MSEEKHVGTLTEVYIELVKANPEISMYPTNEQDADYIKRLVKADPSIVGKGWAKALSCVGANRGSSRPRRTNTDLRQMEISRLWETTCSIRS